MMYTDIIDCNYGPMTDDLLSIPSGKRKLSDDLSELSTNKKFLSSGGSSKRLGSSDHNHHLVRVVISMEGKAVQDQHEITVAEHERDYLDNFIDKLEKKRKKLEMKRSNYSEMENEERDENEEEIRKLEDEIDRWEDAQIAKMQAFGEFTSFLE